MLAQVLDSAAEGEAAAAQGINVPGALEAFNEQRLEDATAACVLSERGMGGARTVRPMFAARLYLTTLLHKTLGRVAPKVKVLSFSPPTSVPPSLKLLTVPRNLGQREASGTNCWPIGDLWARIVFLSRFRCEYRSLATPDGKRVHMRLI